MQHASKLFQVLQIPITQMTHHVRGLQYCTAVILSHPIGQSFARDQLEKAERSQTLAD